MLHVDFLLGLFFDTQDSGDMFLWNVERLATDDTALHLQIQNSSIAVMIMVGSLWRGPWWLSPSPLPSAASFRRRDVACCSSLYCTPSWRCFGCTSRAAVTWPLPRTLIKLAAALAQFPSIFFQWTDGQRTRPNRVFPQLFTNPFVSLLFSRYYSFPGRTFSFFISR